MVIIAQWPLEDGGHHPPVVTEGWCSNWVTMYTTLSVLIGAILFGLSTFCTPTMCTGIALKGKMKSLN